MTIVDWDIFSTWKNKSLQDNQRAKQKSYLWRLLRCQLITQKIDKAKTSIYPIFPVKTLFEGNQKVEEKMFFKEEKVNKHNNDRKSLFWNT